MTQPNIVLIIADQWSTRVADGSGQNAFGVQTPGIDRLASEGVRFTQSYSSFPLCGPARASFFTGLMPHNHLMIDNEEIYAHRDGKYPTRSDIATMGATFKQAGYSTAYFGKEHAGDYGWDGIDEFGSMKYSAGGMLAEGSAYDQIFTRDAIEYIRRDHKRPFYMTLSLINPHDICKVLGGKVKGATFADAIFFCRDDDELYLRNQKRPDLPSNHSAPVTPGMIRHKDYMYEELEAFTENDWKRFLATYCLLVEKTDWYIELVLDAVKNAGLEENTIVLFTTDHGEMMSSHQLIGKTCFYEESAKTMMLVKHPSKIPANHVNEEALVGTIDLMPTMLDLCDLPVPDGLDGNSFNTACYGQSSNEFDQLVSSNPDGYMIRFEQYKYVQSTVYDEPYQILFDLEKDPDETQNVFGHEGYTAVSQQAVERLKAWQKQVHTQ